ncbi:hypothetical protein PR048_027957 [Dryococelus australis]|uniref:Recombination activating protein 1 n=1 Tax=Dryococelus australis TaxID=614101 RepID=A0ABQ9GHY3_9NEOP|nr:hypothetical protein PR048_027957 [Dryococelus australis]
MKVCTGCIPDASLEEFDFTMCQKDSFGQLHHTECPVAIEEGLHLLRTMQSRRQRLKHSKSKEQRIHLAVNPRKREKLTRLLKRHSCERWKRKSLNAHFNRLKKCLLHYKDKMKNLNTD